MATLPTETWDEIFSHLTEYSLISARPDLARCCLISKAHLMPARRILYRTIELDFWVHYNAPMGWPTHLLTPSTARLFHTLRQPSRLGQYVRDLAYRGIKGSESHRGKSVAVMERMYERWDKELLLEHLPNLERMTITVGDNLSAPAFSPNQEPLPRFAAFCQHPESLRRLTSFTLEWSDLFGDEWVDIGEMLQGMHSLKELTIDGNDVDVSSTPLTTSPCYKNVELPTFGLETLSYCNWTARGPSLSYFLHPSSSSTLTRLSFAMPEDDDDVPDLSRFPNLQHLTLITRSATSSLSTASHREAAFVRIGRGVAELEALITFRITLRVAWKCGQALLDRLPSGVTFVGIHVGAEHSFSRLEGVVAEWLRSWKTTHAQISSVNFSFDTQEANAQERLGLLASRMGMPLRIIETCGGVDSK